MNQQQIKVFQGTVWEYYHAHGRHDLPWRLSEPDGSFDPYKIVVSELMLQQTQVARVLPKFADWMVRFPSFGTLAQAPLSEALSAWSGLGYNRRAKFLWQIAGKVSTELGGQLPRSLGELVTLPGVGPNTAGAVLAYAFNRPAVFIETNIRTVFIHHFFADTEQVTDRAILDLVAQTLPHNPREWYWALMDYGTQLKQTVGNLNKLSKHYIVQPAFVGSRRQIRGHILRILSQHACTLAELQTQIADERLAAVLTDLEAEQLITSGKNHYKLFGA